MKLYKLIPDNRKLLKNGFDIVVCAKDDLEAREIALKSLPKQLSQYTSLDVEDLSYRDTVDLKTLAFEMVEIKSYEEIPYGWEDVIPWGNEDFVDDRECASILANNVAEKECDWIVGKKILAIKVRYNTLRLDLEDGSNIEFDLDKADFYPAK